MRTTRYPRRGRTFFSALVGLVLLLSLYTVYDNHRFVVVEQEIVLERLPAAFDGFRILQISDLHGSTFGDHQADLVAAINSLDYDLIALTGDMNASAAGPDTVASSQAILDLLDGIHNKEWVFWIDGNSGPYAIEGTAGTISGGVTQIGAILQDHGARVLVAPVSIRRGAERIWVTPELVEMGFSLDRSLQSDPTWQAEVGAEKVAQYRAFYEQTYAAYQELRGNGEVKILLRHVPKQINLTEAELSQFEELDYDLILAGHYHGGQIRLPLLGAVVIPSPTAGINDSGWFPAPQAVQGLSYYGRTPQYVSTGLGASSHVPWLAFRLFNPPEINVITLRSQ